jgi:hypothetical protein
MLMVNVPPSLLHLTEPSTPWSFPSTSTRAAADELAPVVVEVVFVADVDVPLVVVAGALRLVVAPVCAVVELPLSSPPTTKTRMAPITTRRTKPPATIARINVPRREGPSGVVIRES